MKTVIAYILLFLSFSLFADPFTTEKKILTLSEDWQSEMMSLSGYDGLETFCRSATQRELIFTLLDEIHRYHDLLEEDLKTTEYNHSKRIIRRILKEMDKLDEKYHPDTFTEFFQSQCALQYKIEKSSDHYKAGFGTHSYSGKVYAQEVEMYRYLKRLNKSIARIKQHVQQFYIRRQVWEH